LARLFIYHKTHFNGEKRAIRRGITAPLDKELSKHMAVFSRFGGTQLA